MLAFALGACTYLLTYMPPGYRVSAENTQMLRKNGGEHINVGPFKKTVKVENECGITAGVIYMPGKIGFEDYIRQGLIDELKAAGMYDDASPKITLSGTIDRLSFFSRRHIYTSTWNIGILFTSSNGQSVHLTDQYDFDVGEGSAADCQKVADAYMIAVQKIIGKFFDAPEYQSLVTP